MTNIKKFRSRKDITEYLKNEGIDTSNWNELKWLPLNKGQAEIHMMALAEAMWDAYNESTPKLLSGIPMYLNESNWHVPFGDNIDRAKVADIVFGKDHNISSDCLVDISTLIKFDEVIRKISIARCARVSYTIVGEEGKESNYENDIKLYNRLIESKHASPFEHIALIDPISTSSRNFNGGWKQYREIINL